MKRRILPLAVALCILAPGVAFAQDASRPTGVEMASLFAAHEHDFDYLLGDWEFTTESKTFGRSKGRWSAWRLATGPVLDEFRIIGSEGQTYYATTTVRYYNALMDQWELVGMNGANGLQDRGAGGRMGDEIRIEQRFAMTTAAPYSLRIRYYNIRPNAFSWTADRSDDGGKTWVKDFQRIEARRVGPPHPVRSLIPSPDEAR